MSSLTAVETREISIAHSPDSDDAFMFYGLATNKVQVPGLRFTGAYWMVGRACRPCEP